MRYTRALPLGYMGMTSMCSVDDSIDAFMGNNYRARLYPEVDGVFGGTGVCMIADIKDGTSNTLAIGEVTGAGKDTYIGHMWPAANYHHTWEGINGAGTVPGEGVYPPDYDPSVGGIGPGSRHLSGFSSYHPGGCHFAMADGSAQFLSQNIDRRVLAALTTRNGPSSSNRQKNPAKLDQLLQSGQEPLVSGPP